MSGSLKVSLKAGERIYLNGAVLKTDRKVTLEFLNRVTFLLEQHVMQADATDTPLKQLYFVVQMMLIEPATAENARAIARDMFRQMATAYQSRDVLQGLAEVSVLVDGGKAYDALRMLRELIPLEAANAGEAIAHSRQEAESCRSLPR